MQAPEYSNLSVEPSIIDRLTPEQQERLTDILDRYLSSLESGVPMAREELLAAHPDLAETLKTYLESLDELHDAAAGFVRSTGPSEPETADSAEEKRLGDFRLVREIGRGGMGVVYEARQISLGRRVALKVLPFAAVLDARQIARFKHEAQAAAQLDHPNIVSVFAVGVERGVHYFAMQFIEGQPLDRALAELRGSATCNSFLSEKSTNRQGYFQTVIRLGIQAAEALHAAHEHGIIHRDVKPSNLLLDMQGKLWVTDFGLARCQSDATLTKTGEVMGTARYMSPEQAMGQSALVDQRTDVYSLGVTLYEMLALQPAFPGDDGAVLRRRIEQKEPRRLRQLQPKIPADLETVVHKAMAKRREDRYSTARDFADDLRRVLEGKPTVARPPSLPQRVRKWARRHRRIVATAAAVGLCAVLGMAASVFLIAREKIKADRNYARAERNFRDAREVVDRNARLAERLAGVPGGEQVRRELLQDTVRYYRGFVEQATDNPELQTDLALAYGRIGPLSAELGSNQEALEALDRAVEMFERLAAEHPAASEHRRQLAHSRNQQALVLSRSGRPDAARDAYREAIRLQEELLAGAQENVEYLGDLALFHNNLGRLQSETGESAEAQSSFNEAVRLQERALRLEPNNPQRLRTLAAALDSLGSPEISQRPGRAAQWFEQALAYRRKAAELRPDDLIYQNDLAMSYNNLGAARASAGNQEAAVEAYAQAVALGEKLAQSAPDQQAYREYLAMRYGNLGLAQSKLGRLSDAEQSFRRALALQEQLTARNPEEPDLRSHLGGLYNNLGFLLEKVQRQAEAAKCYQQAVEHQRAAYARAPQVARYRESLSNHYYNYGRALRRVGRPAEAARIALARRDLWPKDGGRLYAVAEELALATRLLAASSKPAGMTAQQCADCAVETLQQAEAAGWKPAGDADWTATFAALKDHPGFAKLVRK